MNPEMVAVLSMRQKELVYQRPPPPYLPPPLPPRGYYPPPQTTTTTSGAGYGPLLQSPVGVGVGGGMGMGMGIGRAASSNAGLFAKARMCYSPLSVGQLPVAGGGGYDQYGFVWHWITDVCAHFALQRQTAHYAVQYAHRILRQRATADEPLYLGNYQDIYAIQKELQVLGLVCVFLAAKIEEVHPPKATEVAEYMTEHGAIACTAEDLVRLEEQYLAELKWNLHPTTVLAWLQFLLAGEALEQPMETMGDFVDPRRAPTVRKDVFVAASYIIDAALLEYQSTEFLPSVLAGAAILLADPALDLVYVAQFLQLDPALLWECKNWLAATTSGLQEPEPQGSRHSDRWAKVPREEMLFIQTRVPVPSHLAYGLLRVEHTVYGYPTQPAAHFEPPFYNGYPSYSSATCISPSSCDTYGCYCADNYGNPCTAVQNVYHFKYGWQGAELNYNPPTVQRKLHFS